MCLFWLVFVPFSVRFYTARQRLNRQLAASKLCSLKAIFQGGRISIRGRVCVIRPRCSSPQTHSRCSKQHSCLYTVSFVFFLFIILYTNTRCGFFFFFWQVGKEDKQMLAYLLDKYIQKSARQYLATGRPTVGSCDLWH